MSAGTYDETTGRCCGFPAYHRTCRQEVRFMQNPPRTTDRWLVTVRWQCHRVEHHHGEFSHTTDEPREEQP